MKLIFLKNLWNNKSKKKKEKNPLFLKNAIILLTGKQKVFNAFKSGIFPKGKWTQEKWLPSILDRKQLKILTPKQMLQRLPLALAELK